jgi:hypothetical protein
VKNSDLQTQLDALAKRQAAMNYANDINSAGQSSWGGLGGLVGISNPGLGTAGGPQANPNNPHTVASPNPSGVWNPVWKSPPHQTPTFAPATPPTPVKTMQTDDAITIRRTKNGWLVQGADVNRAEVTLLNQMMVFTRKHASDDGTEGLFEFLDAHFSDPPFNKAK